MSNKYRVTYYFVDNTYWDDGNRTTSRKKEFDTYDEAIAFCKQAVAQGVSEQSKVTRKTDKFRVDKDSIHLEEVVTKRYPWWYVFNDHDYIVKKIRDYLKWDNYSQLASFEKEVIDLYDQERWKQALRNAKDSM
jgi:hypothetical protein